jgi:hypothetical protein
MIAGADRASRAALRVNYLSNPIKGISMAVMSTTEHESDDSPAPSSPLVRAAQKLVTGIEGLSSQVAELRAENAALRREVREAVSLIERAGAAAGESGGVRSVRRPAAPPTRRRRRRAKGTKGRATPASVTTEVVRAVLAKRGAATASEIASEITAAGATVSGRAIRFLAERAGAQTFVGDDGQRRYRL